MNMELKRRLKTQIIIAWWKLGLSLVTIIGYISFVWLVIAAYRDGDWIDKIYSGLNNGWTWGWIAVIVLSTIPQGVLWILGIVKAIKINELTNKRNFTLVIFSVFNFLILHLIFAYIAKNNEMEIMKNDETIEKNTPLPVKNLRKLKDAFVSGAITVEEYEAKKKIIENNQKNNK